MIVFFCVLFLLFSFVWPFIGGWREMIVASDATPLFINMDYLKDPRYFAISFRRFFKNFLNDENLQPGIYELKFSKPEKVEVLESGAVLSGREVAMIAYARRDLATASDMVFTKEIYVRGNVSIGQNNDLRALVCDGDVSLADRTVLRRWLDAEGNIRAGRDCNLGVSLTSAKECRIAVGCLFRRLYGAPVRVGGFPKKNPVQMAGAQTETRIFPPADEGRELEEIWPYTENQFSVITPHNLKIGASSRILGHVKTYGNLTVEDNVLITGNVFAEGDIFIGRFSQVAGDVFAQGGVTIGENAQIGRPGRVKSVVGNQAVAMAGGAAVYGYVTTEGDGRAL
jgi:acyl-[acyl carrier protein]--UDP-N-acetylglucosamine O-acyltransferase